MKTVSKSKKLKRYLKIPLSMRFFSLFLIFFGLSGTIVWPMTGLYFINSVDQTRSTLESVVLELKSVERMLNESYSRLDSLQKSTSDFESKLGNLLDALNESSLSLLTLSADIKKTSGLLSQASGSPILRLISEDFAEAMKDAAKDLDGLSKAFENQNIGLNDFLKELGSIESMTRIGIKIIDFLKDSFKSFLIIVKFIILRLAESSHTLSNFKYSLLILTLDTTLVHLSLAMIGLIFSRRQRAPT